MIHVKKENTKSNDWAQVMDCATIILSGNEPAIYYKIAVKTGEKCRTLCHHAIREPLSRRLRHVRMGVAGSISAALLCIRVPPSLPFEESGGILSILARHGMIVLSAV